jgi:Tfp pilus assembly protein PilO
MNQSLKSFITFAMVLAILAVAYFGVYDQWNKLSESKAAFDTSKATNEKIKKTETQFNAFLEKFESSNSKAEVANRALPLGTPDIPNILDNFSRMVTDSGMRLVNINFSSVVRGENASVSPQSIDSIDVDLEIKGTYEAYQEYLISVQRSLRIIDVLSMNMTSVEGQSELNFSVKLRTYYQQQ